MKKIIGRIILYTIAFYTAFWTLIGPLDIFGLASKMGMKQPIGYLVFVGVSVGLAIVATFIESKRKENFPLPVIIPPPSEFTPSNLSSELKDLDIKSINVLRVVSKTDYSIVETCSIKGKTYILKRTKKELCDVDTLKRLIGKDYSGKEGRVITLVSTPLAVWLAGQYVWEIHNYFDGYTLHELTVINKYKFQGEVLGAIHNSLAHAINQMHHDRLIHRDIQPANILFQVDQSDIRLFIVDTSFICEANKPASAAYHPNFSPPELQMGQPIFASDWYSFASTIYFLANGVPPDTTNKGKYKKELLNINIGVDFRANYPGDDYDNLLTIDHAGLSLIIEAMLLQDIHNRLSNVMDILLSSSSKTIFKGELLGIMDLKNYGYLIMRDKSYGVVNKEGLKGGLTEYTKEAKSNPDLARYIKGLVSK